MLDLYFINDEQYKPKNLIKSGLEFAGSLEFEIFENLQNKGIIETRFDYYTDFRWGSTFIKQKLLTLKEKDYKSDTEIKQLFDLLQKASIRNNGLIAYAD